CQFRKISRSKSLVEFARLAGRQKAALMGADPAKSSWLAARGNHPLTITHITFPQRATEEAALARFRANAGTPTNEAGPWQQRRNRQSPKTPPMRRRATSNPASQRKSFRSS